MPPDGAPKAAGLADEPPAATAGVKDDDGCNEKTTYFSIAIQ